MLEEEEKKCSKCGVWKLKLKDFYLNKGFIRPSCKECFKKQTAAYAKKNRALRMELGLNDNYSKDRLAYQRAYYHNNRGKYTNYRQKFVQSHPEYYKMYYRARRDGHKSSLYAS